MIRKANDAINHPSNSREYDLTAHATTRVHLLDGIPLLRGTLVGPVFSSGDARQIKVRCPHCRRRGKPVYHLHGWSISNAADALEHRGAHCADIESPLRATGYMIGLIADETGVSQ